MADSVGELLKGLGETPDEIAAFLRGQGIRGMRTQGLFCPVANYLTGCGYWFVMVASHVIAALEQGSETERVRTPPGVLEFIARFDRGEYPDLCS